MVEPQFTEAEDEGPDAQQPVPGVTHTLPFVEAEGEGLGAQHLFLGKTHTTTTTTTTTTGSQKSWLP